MMPAMNNQKESTDSQFFTKMSYEFRTSLNTILMAVELLESEKCVSCAKHHEDYLNQMRQAAEMMSKQLNKSSFKLSSH